MDQRSIRYGVLALVGAMALGLLWAGVGRYRAEQRAAQVAAAGREAVAVADAAGAPGSPRPDGQLGAAAGVEAVAVAPQEIVVHVAGAVVNPGVYRVAAGTRVGDVIAAAGGPRPDGAPDVLNLAAPVADGDKLYVYTKQEAEAHAAGAPPAAAADATHKPVTSSSGGAKPAGGKVNVNTASVAQLDTLRGVGPKLAQDIVDYRKQHGPFKSLQDLDRVSGIGPSTLKTLSDQVTF